VTEPLDLIGTAGAAQICGVPQYRIHRWVNSGVLKPQATVSTRHLWERPVIECWASTQDPTCEGRELDVVGVDYIAGLLGVQPRTVLWRRGQSLRHGEGTPIPNPCGEAPGVLVWWRTDIDAWVKATA
jgi:hypothetical protein